MNATETYEKLLSEGCVETSFCIGTCGSASDAFCLSKNGNLWEVFYTERGYNQDPIFCSHDEREAAEFFYDFVSKQTHQHVIGVFKKEENAMKLETKLNSIGINSIRSNPSSYTFPADRRFRVLVERTDIFPVRETFGAEVEKDT